MKTFKIWRLFSGIRTGHLTLRNAVQTSISNGIVGAWTMLAAFSLVSCWESFDGDWDAMVWKAEVPVQTTDRIYNVSATGGEFTFSCQNYSSPWIAGASSGGEYYFPPIEENDIHTITADWIKAVISGNQLKVICEANDTEKERTLELTVTAGDIFYTFNFKQAANR